MTTTTEATRTLTVQEQELVEDLQECEGMDYETALLIALLN